MSELTAGEADGVVCVRCGRPFAELDVASVPVGRGPDGAQVFACEPACEDEGSASYAGRA